MNRGVTARAGLPPPSQPLATRPATIAQNAEVMPAIANGVAATCRMPSHATTSTPMLLEVWPRLGDDYLDASTLHVLLSEATSNTGVEIAFARPRVGTAMVSGGVMRAP